MTVSAAAEEVSERDWQFLANLENSIGYQLREADRAVEAALAQRLNRHDLPIGMWFYLRALWHEQGISQSDLCRKVNATSATTAVQLAKMEERGLIRRESTRGDKRLLRVYLTELGASLEEQLMLEALDHRRQILEGLTHDEIAITMRTLRKVRQNARK